MKLKLVLDFNRALDDDAMLTDLALAKESTDGVVVRTAHGQYFAEVLDIERTEA
jgi:hypothetical protein